MFRTFMNNRRGFLASGGFSLGSIAFAEMLSKSADAFATDDVTRKPHFAPKAKHVLYLHMVGAPSQLDLFDPKPELVKRHNQPCPEEVTKGRDFAFIGKTSTLAGSPWSFRTHGQSGQMISELLPNLAAVADESAVIRSVHNDEINHAPAQMFLHSGFGRGGRPSLGAWVTDGLGTENEDLPGYVVLLSGPPGGAGTSLWTPGFLPSVHQGIQFRSKGDPILFLTNPAGYKPEDRRRELDGRITTLIREARGRCLNAPNDVVVKSDGSIWFSDPLYGLMTDYEGGRQGSEQPPALYRLDPESGEVEAVASDFDGPNGLAFSPDESLLYVAESGAPGDPTPRLCIRRFRVSDDGRSLSGGEEFHKITPGWADGFQVDEHGNLWCGAADGVHCIAPDSTLLGKVLVPRRVSNLCFGDRGRSRLFLCASTALYALFTNTRGAAAAQP